MKKFYFTGVLVMVLFSVCFKADAQSKFQLHLDYQYLWGVSQKMGDYGTLHRSDAKMGGSSYGISGIYSLNRQWAAGAGIKADCYTNPDGTMYPLYATVHYSPLSSQPNAYAYANLGYALGLGDANKGVTSGLGIGYKWMLRKHFGLKFTMGYNLQQIKVPQEDVFIFDGTDIINPDKGVSMWRHSFTVGFGFVF